MKQNKYDDSIFFEKYSQMARSQKGLTGAGEWQTLKEMLPDFKGKRVLDLGCGMGWHCIYATEQGAKTVVGVDISEKMLAQARAKTAATNISYLCTPIEDVNFASNSFDIVISSLAFHYLSSFDDICIKINQLLTDGGEFIFSVEHPVFTAEGKQDWCYDENEAPLHWPVDNYFTENKRESTFLGESVLKYHRTLTSYIRALLKNGFELTDLAEPKPSAELLSSLPEMKDELRRPMMLIIAAKKAKDER